MFRKYLLLGGALCAVGMGFYACDFAQGPSSTPSSSSSTGQVNVSVDLGQLGVAGRTAAAPNMDPRKVVLLFTSNMNDTVKDTIRVRGTGSIMSSKSYSFPSERTWTLLVTVTDGNRVVMFQGSKAFNVYARKSTTVNVSLDAKYSYLELTAKLPDSTHTVVFNVDDQIIDLAFLFCLGAGRTFGENDPVFNPLQDSSVMANADTAWLSCEEPAVAGRAINLIGGLGCTLHVRHAYISASPAGDVHNISMDVGGILWGLPYLMYSGSDTILVKSGVSSNSKVLTLPYVGPTLPPPNFGVMSVNLQEIGTVSITAAYDSAEFMQTHFDPIP